MIKTPLIGVVLSLGLTAWGAPASAAVITHTLGNDASGFTDGDTPAVFQVGGAQSGQPAPFDQGYGTDGLFGDDFDQSWTHSYGVITDPVLSATLTIGIYDHDSAATGDQLKSLTLDGNDFTADLSSMFEGAGEGGDGQYDVYTVDISGIAADLADGSLTASLALQGPGLVPDLFGGGFAETSTNGANLIFSRLEITTRDTNQVPVPSSLSLWLLGLLLFGLHRHRCHLG